LLLIVTSGVSVVIMVGLTPVHATFSFIPKLPHLFLNYPVVSYTIILTWLISLLMLHQVILIGTFAGRSQQVELGFLIQRQTCASMHTHLDMLYDCQPGKLP